MDEQVDGWFIKGSQRWKASPNLDKTLVVQAPATVWGRVLGLGSLPYLLFKTILTPNPR